MKTIITLCSVVVILLAWITLPRESVAEDQNNCRSDISGNITLIGNINLVNGTVSPGCSPGILTITGDFTMGTGATYKAELKDLTGAGKGNDLLDVSGNVTLDGTLDVLLDGYTPDDVGQFEIISYGGSLSGTFSTINWPAAMTTWTIDYGVLNSGKVTIYGPDSPLPIELLYFRAKREKEDVLLSWKTISEQNSDYFMVEHSKDGMVFSELKHISAMGTTNSDHHYSWKHYSPVKGINFYRLKQVDKDGQYAYSSIVSIQQNDATMIGFYPNPSKDILNFSVPISTIVIHDQMGKEVFKANQVGTDLDISSVPTGVYLMNINNETATYRLVVSR